MSEGVPLTPIYLMIRQIAVSEQMPTGGFNLFLTNDQEGAKTSMINDGYRVFELLNERFLEDLSS